MKFLKQTLLLILLLMLSSCSTNKNSIYWVNSLKSPCDSGAGKMQCLLITKNDTFENANWNYFYSPIEGFNFKPGYFQKIEVKETHMDKDKVIADGSSIHYSLIKILEEVKDERFGINDIWVVEKINRNAITGNSNLPQLEIHLAKMQVLGNDGCNNYNGAIEELTATKIKIGDLLSTRKMCPNMEMVNQYNKALTKTISYKKEGLKLFFFDNKGNETLAFKKID